MEVVEDDDVDEIIRTLLFVACGRHRLPKQIAAQNLTEEQRAVLHAIAQSHRAWHTPDGVGSQVGTTDALAAPDAMVVLNDDLGGLGLPSSQQDLLDFLG